MVANRYKQMIPSPNISSGLSGITHPFANRDAAVRKAVATMSRIRRVAKHMKFDAANQEVVRKGLKELLESSGPGVPAFIRDTLHGRFGAYASQAAREMFLRGIDVSDPNSSTSVTMSVAGICLAHGTLDILREVALSGVPSAENLGGNLYPSPPTPSRWLDLLCTTLRDRLHPSWTGFDENFDGLVGLAARHHQFWPEHCEAALEVALEVDKDHRGFHLLVDEQSGAGAFVREYFMRRVINVAPCPVDAESAPAPLPARARRTGL